MKKKFLSLVLALMMLLSLAACGGNNNTPAEPTPDTPPADTQPPADDTQTDAPAEPGAFQPVTYEEEAVYMNALGDFYNAYLDALDEEDLDMRWAKSAVAEGKLISSGTVSFTICKGGNYAFGRVAPKTSSPVLYGTDRSRYHQYIVTDQIITRDDRLEMSAKYAELETAAEYDQWAKEFLTSKGYTIKDTFNYEGYDNEPQTFDILASSQSGDGEVLCNTIEGLMEWDIKNVLQPALATGYEVSEDGLTWTFHIREGVVWTDSQGRKVADVKADDWVAGMEHLYDCGAGLEDLLNGIILNATEYNNGDITDFSQVGVKALDDYTLQYTLAAPCPYLHTMLGYSMFVPMSRSYYESQGGKFGMDFDASAESYKYGKSPDTIAYCGPYLITNYTPKNTIVFQLSDSYWNKDNINIKTLTWLYNDGSDATKAYEDTKSGVCDSAGLSSTTLELAKKEKLDGDDQTIFDKYYYNSATDATTYFGWFNLARRGWANYNDNTKLVSQQTHESADAIDVENGVYTSDIVDDAARTHAALNNKNFRLALSLCLDRGGYNSLRMGEDLKYASMINSVVPGTFVTLTKDVTVDINGTSTTFPAGTRYGEIVQAQVTADGLDVMVFNPEADDGAGSSSGYDGWYRPEAAKEYMAKAIEELNAQGVDISAENPILLDQSYYAGSEMFTNQANFVKKAYEGTFDCIKVLQYETPDFDEYNRAVYYPETGAEMNFDFALGSSGWGPDYGDPATWLNCFLPYGEGYMVKNLGIY